MKAHSIFFWICFIGLTPVIAFAQGTDVAKTDAQTATSGDWMGKYRVANLDIYFPPQNRTKVGGAHNEQLLRIDYTFKDSVSKNNPAMRTLRVAQFLFPKEFKQTAISFYTLGMEIVNRD